MAETTIVGRAKIARPARYVRSKVSTEIFEHTVWPYRLVLPFMVVTALYVHAKKFFLSLNDQYPAINCWYVDGLSKNSRRVKEGSAKWQALDACYNFSHGEGKNWFTRTLDMFWMNVRNAQAVRNRLIIAREELCRAIINQANNSPNREVKILSLAAGSAQAVIEALSALRRSQNVHIRAVLIDQDETALAHAEALARDCGVADLVETRLGDVLFFDRILGEFRPDIIEMMGLMDYLRDKLAVQLLRKIYRYLPEGGSFLTCHIHPNSEAYFLRQVVDWKMLYRTVGQFEDILVGGGFLDLSFRTERHNIHTVAIATKTAQAV
ncbi:hypothetical protein COU13_00905 [Candidatus Kaiserbacteria bacterium CG10_big_fil_rev_8_21_14_0_10_43_70]|uniref:Methyltransferase domain-containing protein n=1 Tax=Candidatus Kaiserbacteria bacterium CG10_big_fil_rev_8_21_14_0_10_43_70 TaxID=1974605 RepID=A0A2H0UJ48_9BACT|nr:MAG: hypothetical protein COU13_00905 [Candidatus Kaiserbacteria bacterium CG10_big_fil_rev_8_21_14_0_10_43_70]